MKKLFRIAILLLMIALNTNTDPSKAAAAGTSTMVVADGGPTKYGEVSVKMAKKVTTSTGVTYGFLTETENTSGWGVLGGSKIYLSHGGRWYNTNFNLRSDYEVRYAGVVLSLDATAFVTDVRNGQKGRAYFLVIYSAPNSYQDKNFGFAKNPNLLEVVRADGGPDLVAVAQFEGHPQELQVTQAFEAAITQDQKR